MIPVLLAFAATAGPAAVADHQLRTDLRRVTERHLEPDGDAAAVIRLADGHLMLDHRPAILRQRRMMPGSVMKLVSGYALATAGADREHHCRGAHRASSGQRRPCWYRPGHGALRLRTALAHSCNVWFYAQADRLTPAAWLRAVRAFGFGAPGSDARIARDLVPHAVPTTDLPDLMVGDHVSLRVTPMSLLRAVSVFASGGLMSEPGRTPQMTALDPDALRWVVEGMVAAADDGTLTGLFPDGTAAAKTGTAKRYRAPGTRGWVVGFTPRDRPIYAFVVVKDRGRGGPDAGPVAAALVRALTATGTRQ